MGVRAASSTHGSRRGPHSAAPNGAVKAFPQVRRRSRLSCSTGTNLRTARERPGFAQKIKNRGNEAKESLKTKEVAKTMCAKRTHICARKPANEAKKATFRCKRVTRVAHTCRPLLSACMRPRGSAGRRHAKERHVCTPADSEIFCTRRLFSQTFRLRSECSGFCSMPGAHLIVLDTVIFQCWPSDKRGSKQYLTL